MIKSQKYWRDSNSVQKDGIMADYFLPEVSFRPLEVLFFWGFTLEVILLDKNWDWKLF